MFWLIVGILILSLIIYFWKFILFIIVVFVVFKLAELLVKFLDSKKFETTVYSQTASEDKTLSPNLISNQLNESEVDMINMHIVKYDMILADKYSLDKTNKYYEINKLLREYDSLIDYNKLVRKKIENFKSRICGNDNVLDNEMKDEIKEAHETMILIIEEKNKIKKEFNEKYCIENDISELEPIYLELCNMIKEDNNNYEIDTVFNQKSKKVIIHMFEDVVYFFTPKQVYIYKKKLIVDIKEYSELELEIKKILKWCDEYDPTNEIVSKTWEHANKNGDRDNRYNRNRLFSTIRKADIMILVENKIILQKQYKRYNDGKKLYDNLLKIGFKGKES